MISRWSLAAVLIPFCPTASIAVPPQLELGPFAEWQMHVNRLAVMATNFGKLGNDFRSRAESSFEFPEGSDHEHMTRGGLWVGGLRAADEGGPDSLVAAGAVDGYAGGGLSDGTDFVALRDQDWTTLGFELRSTDPFGNYHPDAIADYEIHAWSRVPVEPVGSPAPVTVKSEMLGWRHAAIEDVVFLRYTVFNHDPAVPLSDVYLGVLAELVTGNKAASDRWPPGGDWFGRQNIEYVPDRQCVLGNRFEAPLDVLYADSWCGIALLGSDPPASAQFNWWNWDPAPESEAEMYARMSTGAVAPTEGDEGAADDIEPIVLLSVGPIASLAANAAESIVFEVALVGGESRADALANVDAARAFHASGYDISTPTHGADPEPPVDVRADAPRIVAPDPIGASSSLSIRSFVHAHLCVEVFDVRGRRVGYVDLGDPVAGKHVVPWARVAPAGDFASGVYVLRVRSGERVTATRVRYVR